MCPTAFLGRTQIRCVSHQRARNQDQLAFVLECNKKIQRCAALINALCQKVKFRGGWGGTSDLIFVQKKTPVSDFTPSATEEELIDELTSCSLRV